MVGMAVPSGALYSYLKRRQDIPFDPVNWSWPFWDLRKNGTPKPDL
jgi:hypothetical protein